MRYVGDVWKTKKESHKHLLPFFYVKDLPFWPDDVYMVVRKYSGSQI